jgi:hypothetical protein
MKLVTGKDDTLVPHEPSPSGLGIYDFDLNCPISIYMLILSSTFFVASTHFVDDSLYGSFLETDILLVVSNAAKSLHRYRGNNLDVQVMT